MKFILSLLLALTVTEVFGASISGKCYRSEADGWDQYTYTIGEDASTGRMAVQEDYSRYQPKGVAPVFSRVWDASDLEVTDSFIRVTYLKRTSISGKHSKCVIETSPLTISSTSLWGPSRLICEGVTTKLSDCSWRRR